MSGLESDLTEGVLTLTMNRPEARNSLSVELLEELQGALAGARTADQVRVVVLTGAGDRAFCAGADLSLMGAGAGHLEGHFARRRYLELVEALWHLGKPTIAAVNGAALAGGFGLVLACDLAVAAETAAFGTPEVNVGLMPMMVMALLQRHLGRKRALELIYTGERVTAVRALELGLVNRVVPAGDLLVLTQAFAQHIAGRSPAALRLGREAFQAASDMEFGQALRHLHAMLTVTTATEDAMEGVAAFIEKRAPRWQGK